MSGHGAAGDVATCIASKKHLKKHDGQGPDELKMTRLPAGAPAEGPCDARYFCLCVRKEHEWGKKIIYVISRVGVVSDKLGRGEVDFNERQYRLLACPFCF